METIWHYAFYKKLHVDPSEHPVLLAEAPLNSLVNREKMISVMFETFNVPSFYAETQAILSMYSSVNTTGIALDSGYGLTQIVPMYEGYKISKAIMRLNFAGSDLTEWMVRLLNENGFAFNTPEGKEIVRYIKEKFCYVALDFDAEMEKAAKSPEINRTYQLPSGKTSVSIAQNCSSSHS